MNNSNSGYIGTNIASHIIDGVDIGAIRRPLVRVSLSPLSEPAEIGERMDGPFLSQRGAFARR